MATVSYTHLDVYKRQVVGKIAHAVIRGLVRPEGNGLRVGLEAGKKCDATGRNQAMDKFHLGPLADLPAKYKDGWCGPPPWQVA